MATPEWQFVALTSFPDGQKKTGSVVAATLSEAVEKIRTQGLFPVEIKLPSKKERRKAQKAAAIEAIINRLKQEGIKTKLTRQGDLIIFSSEPESE